jgi:signal transduction histidine kinase
MHQFKQAGFPETTPTCLRGAIQSLLGEIRGIMSSRTTFQVTIPTELPKVSLGTQWIQQVIRQILLNAIEATGEGSVSLNVETKTFDELQIKGFFGRVSPGTYVSATVADTGTGIDPKVYSRLFVEPFFTTRPHHRGLGLAMTLRILHAAGGGLRIESTPGRGTVVSLAFPVARTDT